MPRKKGKAASVSRSGPLDKLPVEMVTHIFSFLRLPEVFVCKSVSQKWKAAANAANGQRRTLVLVVENHRRGDEIAGWDDLTLPEKFFLQYQKGGKFDYEMSDAEAVSFYEKHFSGWKKLHRLIVESFEPIANPILLKLVQSNSLTLIELRAPENSLPDMGLTFPSMDKLQVASLSGNLMDMFPHLTKLEIERISSINSSIQTPRITSLICKSDWVPVNVGQKFVTGISQCAQLKELELMIPIPEQYFARLFDHMNQLKNLNLMFPQSYEDTQTDEVIRTIVNRNQNLTHISFNLPHLTDRSAQTLARLSRLERIALFQSRNMSGDAILSLLTGSSRATIREMRITAGDNRRWNLDQVNEELQRMTQETGLFLFTAGLGPNAQFRIVTINFLTGPVHN